jgi:hypothetical protein
MPGAASRATATARGARSRTAIEKRREPLAARLAHHAFLADDRIVESVRFDARSSPPAHVEKITPALSRSPAHRNGRVFTASYWNNCVNCFQNSEIRADSERIRCRIPSTREYGIMADPLPSCVRESLRIIQA